MHDFYKSLSDIVLVQSIPHVPLFPCQLSSAIGCSSILFSHFALQKETILHEPSKNAGNSLYNCKVVSNSRATREVCDTIFVKAKLPTGEAGVISGTSLP